MEKCIRVLQMIGSLNMGGSQSMIMNIYRGIDRKKVQFDFIIDKSDELFFFDEIEKLGGNIYILPSFNGLNQKEIKESWELFFKTHLEYKILHSHVRSYASLYLPIARKYGIKTIIHSHSTSSGSGIKSLVKQVMQLPLRYQADYLFSCSEESGRWLFGKSALSKKNYKMIPNAIDCSKYKYNLKIRKMIRNQYGLKDNELLFGHVGRFSKPKNHNFLIDIFAEFSKNHDAKLMLIGDGELRINIEQRIEKLGIQDNVMILGTRTDVNKLMQAMDVFLFPSLWEGLPVTIIEAQASGLPCFVSNRVTKDVNVSSLIYNISLNQNAADWCKIIENTNLERQNVIEDIKKAGFDIEGLANWMEDFYRGLIDE